MTYIKKYNYTIIRKHWVALFFRYLKPIFNLFIAWLLFYISMKFSDTLWKETLNYLLFPSIFILVNYAFIKLILSYIKFFNDFLIIYDWQIIVIKNSLYFIDEIEFIDINKITKLDTISRWFFENILWYWSLIIEQQSDQIIKFNFISTPSICLRIIKAEREKIKKKGGND